MKEECLFCKIANKEVDAKIIYEDDLVIAFLDAYPDVSGHTLIVPKQHFETYKEIDDTTLAHISKVAKDLGPMLMKKFNQDGMALIVNYGSRQFIKHYHLHLLPGYSHTKKESILTKEQAFEIITKD